ncbi:MAG: hypothetical protein AAB968_01685, partial [Patescibacteria group bacterium]
MTQKKLVVAIIVLIVAVLAGWWLWRQKYPSVQPPSEPVFSAGKQFIPEGAASRTVDQSLAAFGLPKPLPFFDEKNVVQSITNTVDISTSTIHQGNSPYLSYRICGQNIEAVRTALINYFENTDWKTMKKKLPDRSGSMLTFSANSA